MSDLSAPGDLDAARRHLAWLCGHPDARLTKRLRRLLAYLLERSVIDTGAAPSQTDIARDVLDRSDFDPSVDAHARVEMARLRTALELFYARLDTEPPVRFELPKGKYSVILKRKAQPAPEVRQKPENDCIVALAEPVAFAEDAREFGQLILSETLHRCSQSPIVRSGALSVTLLPPFDHHAGAVEAARAAGAAAVAVSQIHNDERGPQVFVTVFDTVARSLVCTRSFTLETGASRCDLARKVSAALSAVLSDPFAGVGPQIVGRRTGNARLNAILSACGFIGSQELDHAPFAFNALQHVVDRDGESCPTTLALFADMHRVCHNTGMLPDASREKAFELADRAYRADRGNAAAKLAYGYAALAADCPEIAASVGAEPLADGIGDVWRADHTLLTALTAFAFDLAASKGQEERDAASFLTEMAAVIAAIRRSDEWSALDMLGEHRCGDTMWHDVFRSIAAGHAGERRLARQSVARLARAIPEVGSRVVPMLAGFLPDPGELDYLAGGLRKAGLSVEAASG